MPNSNFSELGSTGLKAWGGYVQEDFLREWRLPESYKRAREMTLNSPIVGALLNAVEQSIRGVAWSVTSDNGDEDPRIELLDSAMHGMSHSWNDHVIEALDMLPFGFAIFEVVYERRDGKVFWKKLAVRGQDTVQKWDIDDNGALQGFTQAAAPLYVSVYIPVQKMILYRTKVKRNNPEGFSILRNAWVPYYYCKNIQQIEAIGVERDLAGMPVITLPQNATVDPNDKNSDANKAAKMVRNIRRDEQEGIVLPFGWDLKLLSTGGSRQFDTDAIINRYESRILMASLAQFLLLGQEKVGSLALSKDQTDFFTMSANATADIISETLMSQAIPRLMELNGFDAEGLHLEHSPAGDVDGLAVADMLAKAGSNITWTAQDEEWLRQVMHLPELGADEIQRLRDEKEAKSAAIAQSISGGKQEQNRPDPNKQAPNEDEQQGGKQVDGMDIYAVSGGNIEENMAGFENKATRSVWGFLSGERDRILKAAKGIQRW